jgi:hypothetical protein
MQRLFLAIGSIAILASSFFGTLYFLDPADFHSMDARRVEHAQSLKAALEKYRAARGKYPAPFADNDVADLKIELVDGGFIQGIPVDPYWKNGKINKYRYRSDGNTYSLLFYFELGACQTGVGPATIGEWNGHNVPLCSF